MEGLVLLNELTNPDLVYVGQRLALPSSVDGSETPEPSPTAMPVEPTSTPMPAPPDEQREGRWIDVDISEQRLTAYEGETPVHTTLVFSNGEQTTIDFEDTRGLQEFAMVRAPRLSVETTSVRVIIEEVYPGTRYDDTCLAEVWGVTK